jgi:hypothetical protein
MSAHAITRECSHGDEKGQPHAENARMNRGSGTREKSKVHTPGKDKKDQEEALRT